MGRYWPTSHKMEDLNAAINTMFWTMPRVFPKMKESKDPNELSKLLEELTGQLRECKRLMKEFDREIEDHESQIPPEINKRINMMKQRNIYMLNKYVDIGMKYTSSLGNKRLELLDGIRIGDPVSEDNVRMTSATSNKELLDARKMNETDRAIKRSDLVVDHTIEVGAKTTEIMKKEGCLMILLFFFVTFCLATSYFIMEMVDPFNDLKSAQAKLSSAHAFVRFQ